jgi:hypothetical protein
MTELSKLLSNLHRPRTLVRAARHGLSDYNRARDIRRITGRPAQATSEAIVETLVYQEQQMEQTRKDRDADYSIARHIELLVALMAECRLLPGNIRV